MQKILHNYFIQSNNNSVIDLFIKDLKQLFFCLDVSKDDIIKNFVFCESLIVLFLSVKQKKNWKTILKGTTPEIEMLQIKLYVF